MIDVLKQSIKQRLLPQILERIPEPQKVMSQEEEVKTYSIDAKYGGLAVLYELIVTKLLKIVPQQGKKALDIACGPGVLLSKIAQELPEMKFTGIDLSEEMLEFAKKNVLEQKLLNIKLQKADMFEIDRIFQKEKFDLITWCFSAHHCDNEFQITDLINKSLKILKKDGILFIFDLVRAKTDGIALWIADKYSKFSGESFYNNSLNSHRAAFSYKEFKNILRNSDWKNYEHIQPFIANSYQFVSTKKINRNFPNRKIDLQSSWQKRDFYLLKCAFRGTI